MRSQQRQNESTRAQTDDVGVFPAQGNPHAEIYSPIRPQVRESWAKGEGRRKGWGAQATVPERRSARTNEADNRNLRTLEPLCRAP